MIKCRYCGMVYTDRRTKKGTVLGAWTRLIIHIEKTHGLLEEVRDTVGRLESPHTG